MTGGPDMSLMEVNEASCVIQEAAHEDANIIFGAVVDPTLTGKMKITVIATGFERTSTTQAVPAAAIETPTDLQSYTAHAGRAAEAAEAEQPVMEFSPATAGGAAAHRQPRRVLDLSPSPAAPDGDGLGSRLAEFGVADVSSRLDIPAFLRRQS